MPACWDDAVERMGSGQKWPACGIIATCQHRLGPPAWHKDSVPPLGKPLLQLSFCDISKPCACKHLHCALAALAAATTEAAAIAAAAAATGTEAAAIEAAAATAAIAGQSLACMDHDHEQ